MIGPHDSNEPDYSIRAVERVCDLLDLLQHSQGSVSLHEAARTTGIAKSTVFRYLATLEARRYAERDEETGSYRLGLALLPLQTRQIDLLVQRARPYLERLGEELVETVSLTMLEGNRVLHLDAVQSRRKVRCAAQRGDHDPVHATAAGKAIASMLGHERVSAILAAEGMPSLTERTITDAGVFLKELDATRERGWAVENRERDPDGRAIAVPLAGTHLPAALTLLAPAVRFRTEEVRRAVGALTEAVRSLVTQCTGTEPLHERDGEGEHEGEL